jgi:hypothetical protein
MPRRYSDSYLDRRAEEKYWDYIYDNCLCKWYETEDGNFEMDESDPCTHCRWEAKKAARAAREEAERQAAAAAHPHAHEISTLKKWLAHVEQGRAEGNMGKQLDGVRALFTEMLGFSSFVAKYPKFRTAVVNKLAEFRENEHAAPLKELFDHVDTFLARLPERDDYVA